MPDNEATEPQQVEKQVTPHDESFFARPSTPAAATAPPPAPAVSSSKPVETPAPTPPPAPTQPEIPAELSELAQSMGFSREDVASFQGDAKSLMRTIGYVARSRPAQAAPTQPAAPPAPPPEEVFDPEQYVKDGYDAGIQKLAKQIAKLAPLAAKYEALEKLGLDKVIPVLQQDMHTRQHERGRAQVIDAVKEAGFDPSVLTGEVETRAVSLLNSMAQSFRQSGQPMPPLKDLLKSVLPLVGAAAPASATAGQPAGREPPPSAPPRAPSNGADNSDSVANAINRMRQHQDKALQRERDPETGKFVAAPAHRGGVHGNPHPLHDFLADHGIDPGPARGEEDNSFFDKSTASVR